MHFAKRHVHIHIIIWPDIERAHWTTDQNSNPMNNWLNKGTLMESERKKKFQRRIILGHLSHFTCTILSLRYSVLVGQLLYNYIRYYGSTWIINTHMNTCGCVSSSVPSIHSLWLARHSFESTTLLKWHLELWYANPSVCCQKHQTRNSETRRQRECFLSMEETHKKTVFHTNRQNIMKNLSKAGHLKYFFQQILIYFQCETNWKAYSLCQPIDITTISKDSTFYYKIKMRKGFQGEFPSRNPFDYFNTTA